MNNIPTVGAANPRMKIDLSQATDVKCEQEGCGSGLFHQVYMMKHFSEVSSPTGEAVHIPIPIFACANCGHVNKAFFPKATQTNATPSLVK